MKAKRHVYPLSIALTTLSVCALAAADGGACRLNVEILNMAHDKGQIGCSLWTKAEGFPSQAQKASATTFVKPKARKATCVFRGLKPGVYAVSVMHDIDNDGRLATSVVGRPQEPWGVSKDVPAERFGPPKYQPATFELDGGEETIRVTLQR